MVLCGTVEQLRTWRVHFFSAKQNTSRRLTSRLLLFNHNEMALQLGLRRTLTSTSFATSKCASQSALGGFASQAMRLKSTDAGDVIGIDLGTTNSCVAIMVRRFFVPNETSGGELLGSRTAQDLTHLLCSSPCSSLDPARFPGRKECTRYRKQRGLADDSLGSCDNRRL